MKNTFYISIAVALTFAAYGCSSSDKEDNGADSAKAPTPTPAPVVEKDSVADTVPAQKNIPFHVKQYGEKKGDNVLDMEYPVSGNPELLGSVRNWMNEQLTDTYRGNLDDADAFFRHYVARMGEDEEFYDEGVYTYDNFKVGYVNDCIVTYDYTSYIYEGGEHEDGGTYGITFLQSDGSIFNRDCITSYKDLHPLIIEGLKEYFKVATDDELKDHLFSSNSLNRLSPPGRDPWLNEDGVVFSYVPYEIAPFDAGSPHFTIPYAEIEPFLTPHGKRFIKGKDRIDDFRDRNDDGNILKETLPEHRVEPEKPAETLPLKPEAPSSSGTEGENEVPEE